MKHSLIRQTIVDTASRLFYQNGYNRTGINQIIDEAGIAKATLYSHFRSKDDICVAYLRYRNETFLRDLAAYVADRPAGKGQILAVFDFLVSFFKEGDFNGCWCINTISEIPKDNVKVRAEIRTQKEKFLALLRTLITGDRPEDQKTALARRVYLLYEGAIAESHLLGEPWPIHSARELCEQILD